MAKTQLFLRKTRRRSKRNAGAPGAAIRSVRARGDVAQASGACPECNARPLLVRGRDCAVQAGGCAFVARAITQCCGRDIGLLAHKPAMRAGDALELGK